MIVYKHQMGRDNLMISYAGCEDSDLDLKKIITNCHTLSSGKVGLFDSDSQEFKAFKHLVNLFFYLINWLCHSGKPNGGNFLTNNSYIVLKLFSIPRNDAKNSLDPKYGFIIRSVLEQFERRVCRQEHSAANIVAVLQQQRLLEQMRLLLQMRLPSMQTMVVVIVVANIDDTRWGWQKRAVHCMRAGSATSGGTMQSTAAACGWRQRARAAWCSGRTRATGGNGRPTGLAKAGVGLTRSE
ncbi:hypothetical protein ACLOJK_007003 [Asimina triloba]